MYQIENEELTVKVSPWERSCKVFMTKEWKKRSSGREIKNTGEGVPPCFFPM